MNYKLSTQLTDWADELLLQCEYIGELRDFEEERVKNIVDEILRYYELSDKDERACQIMLVSAENVYSTISRLNFDIATRVEKVKRIHKVLTK